MQTTKAAELTRVSREESSLVFQICPYIWMEILSSLGPRRAENKQRRGAAAWTAGRVWRRGGIVD
jgi:hypothetical protein